MARTTTKRRKAKPDALARRRGVTSRATRRFDTRCAKLGLLTEDDQEWEDDEDGNATPKAKLTTRCLERFFSKYFEIENEDASQEMIHVLMLRIRAALLAGRPVGLLNIGALTPYMKGATKRRMPGKKRVLCVPPRRYIRFSISVGLKSDMNAG